jgi:hypothetical protein
MMVMPVASLEKSIGDVSTTGGGGGGDACLIDIVSCFTAQCKQSKERKMT